MGVDEIKFMKQGNLKKTPTLFVNIEIRTKRCGHGSQCSSQISSGDDMRRSYFRFIA